MFHAFLTLCKDARTIIVKISTIWRISTNIFRTRVPFDNHASSSSNQHIININIMKNLIQSNPSLVLLFPIKYLRFPSSSNKNQLYYFLHFSRESFSFFLLYRPIYSLGFLSSNCLNISSQVGFRLFRQLFIPL